MLFPLYDNNPTRRTPVVTIVLIVANVAVWLLQVLVGMGGVSWLAAGYGLVPSRITYDPLGESFTALTSMFMHGDLGHIAWNMIYLWIFGDNVEEALGHVRFALFYVLCGLAAASCQYFLDPSSTIPMLGASGAIAGVLAAYLVLYPRAPVVVFHMFIPLWLLMGPLLALPAWLVLGLWFAGDLVNALGVLREGTQPGVAFFAHIGGFVAGLLLVRPLMLGRHRQTTERWSGWQAPPRPRNRPRVFWRDDRGDGPFWR